MTASRSRGLRPATRARACAIGTVAALAFGGCARSGGSGHSQMSGVAAVPVSAIPTAAAPAPAMPPPAVSAAPSPSLSPSLSPSSLAPASPHGHQVTLKNAGAADAELATLDIDALRAEMRKARGHGLIVHLWATWCGPCLDELPMIERLAIEARARGVQVLSVSLDNDYRGIAHVGSVLRDRAPSLTVAVAHFDDPDRFIALFSPTWEGTIPALFVFDAAGALRASVNGEVDWGTLEAALARVASRAPSPGLAPERPLAAGSGAAVVASPPVAP